MKVIEGLLVLFVFASCDGFVGEVSVAPKDGIGTRESLKSYRLPTTSMEPTIGRDEQILVDESAYENVAVGRGDIITYRLPTNRETVLVKRVVALPGETVEISHKVLLVNGKRAEESYGVHTDENDYSGTTKPEPYRSRDSFGPFTVPPLHYFVLGDNRDSAMDSRYHGAVPRQLVVGKVLKAAGEKGIRDVH
jgi:signal peptidase I